MSSGFVCPWVIGLLLKSQEQNPLFAWGLIYYSSAVLAAGGATLFLFFGSAEVQDWDREASDLKKLHQEELTPRKEREL